MKKRTAFIGAILFLIPLGQPLIIKTGVAVSSAGLSILFSEKVNAESAQFYINRGSDKLDAEDYKGAISDYSKAIKINPNDGDGYFNRGLAKQNLKDYKGAISDYSKAIKINPDDVEAYFYRGVAKQNLKDYKGAINDNTEVIKINPDDSEAYYNRGVAKQNLKDYKGAISDYSKAIKINPDVGDFYLERAYIKLSLGDYKGGVSDKNKALKIFSKEKIELSIKDILSPQILKGKEIKYKAYKKLGRFKDETYSKPITYYIHDKTSRKTLEISDDEERFIVDFFNYIDPYIDLDFERVDSKGKAIMRFYKTISDNQDAIEGTGNMEEPGTLSGKFYLDLSWSDSKIIYPRMKNYPTLSIDDAYTITHEIGHALGLEHYDEGSRDISYSNIDPEDVRINSSHTVMSYNVFLYPNISLKSFYTELDIKALRRVWGVEKNN